MPLPMHDAFDNPLTCANAEAAAAYDRAVEAQLHAWPGLQAALDGALAADPRFALAWGLQGLVHLTWSRVADARAAADRAEQCAGAGLSEREQSHLTVLLAILRGRPAEALDRVIEHARRHPSDLLAASTALGAYGLFAFSGRADHNEARLAFTEALQPLSYPWLLAYRGWAHIEAGALDEGLAMAEQAIARRPANGHNAHIVMHGLQEAARPRAALAFIERWIGSYPEDALMWGHLQWHAALAEMALGELDAALTRLRGPILGYLERGTPFMGLPDIASLLWRLALQGARDLPWPAAQAFAARHFQSGSNVFGELHLAMLAAARGDAAALATVVERLDRLAGKGHAGAPVARDWTQALLGMHRGDIVGARERIDACAAARVRLGGSHLQREVVALTKQRIDAVCAA
jgi:tetratricopeptide (TPR) repeat protein